MQCLLGAFVLLCSTSVCAQVTPGDEDPNCVARLGDANDKPGVKVLLDSRHYMQLLGVEGAVWDQIDFDDNNPSGFVPTYVSHTLYLKFYVGWYILHASSFIICSCSLSVATQCWWFMSMVCYVMWLQSWISG